MSSTYPWLAKYEKGVPPTVTIPDVPVQQLLIDAAAKYPDKIGVRMVLKYLPLGIAVQAKMTYRDLNRQSDQLAAALASLGVGKGSHVAIMLPNMPQEIIAYFGILKAGATIVNTNPTYPAHELEPLMQLAGVETIITLSGLYDRVLEIQPKTSIKNIIITDIPDYIGKLFRNTVAKTVRATGMMKEVTPKPGTYFLRDLLATAPAKAPAITFDPSKDTAVFQFTGGTTGLPKAAELTHYNLVANITQVLAWVPSLIRGGEKVLFALPGFHVYGMTAGLLFGTALAAEIVIVPDPRNTPHILDVIAKEKISVYPGVPAMYIAIINNAKAADYNLRSIKVCLSGGSALPVEVSQKFEEITGGKLVEAFGMSECSPAATVTGVLPRRFSSSPTSCNLHTSCQSVLLRSRCWRITHIMTRAPTTNMARAWGRPSARSWHAESATRPQPTSTSCAPRALICSTCATTPATVSMRPAPVACGRRPFSVLAVCR